jgi:hypothetical protein
LVFKEIVERLFIERMDLNEDLFARYMNNPEFQELVAAWLGQQVYSKIPKQVAFEKPKRAKTGRANVDSEPGSTTTVESYPPLSAPA